MSSSKIVKTDSRCPLCQGEVVISLEKKVPIIHCSNPVCELVFHRIPGIRRPEEKDEMLKEIIKENISNL